MPLPVKVVCCQVALEAAPEEILYNARLPRRATRLNTIFNADEIIFIAVKLSEKGEMKK